MMFKTLLRWIIALWLAVSAVAKIYSIEAFELFVYSSSFLSYDAATFVARLIISAELIFAICLAFKIKFKLVWWLTMLLLAVFSGFLIPQWFSETENCFCMGELIKFSPGQSLAKNLVLLVMLLLIYRGRSYAGKYANPLFALVILITVITTFIVSPPDALIANRFSPAEYDTTALLQSVEAGEIPSEFVAGRGILTFYSTGCKFCKLASTRLAAVMDKYDLPTENLRIVFVGDSAVDANRFFEETKSPVFANDTLRVKPFLQITKGRMPLILLIEDGMVQDQMTYRTLDEERITSFLKGEGDSE